MKEIWEEHAGAPCTFPQPLCRPEFMSAWKVTKNKISMVDTSPIIASGSGERGDLFIDGYSLAISTRREGVQDNAERGKVLILRVKEAPLTNFYLWLSSRLSSPCTQDTQPPQPRHTSSLSHQHSLDYHTQCSPRELYLSAFPTAKPQQPTHNLKEDRFNLVQGI